MYEATAWHMGFVWGSPAVSPTLSVPSLGIFSKLSGFVRHSVCWRSFPHPTPAWRAFFFSSAIPPFLFVLLAGGWELSECVFHFYYVWGQAWVNPFQKDIKIGSTRSNDLTCPKGWSQRATLRQRAQWSEVWLTTWRLLVWVLDKRSQKTI